jgi:hypothetical protein
MNTQLIINCIVLAFQLVVCGITAFFMWVTATRANTLKDSLLEIASLKRQMTIFETDFSEKFDQFVKKLGSRQAMRARREEEPQDSNTASVLLPV